MRKDEEGKAPEVNGACKALGTNGTYLTLSCVIPADAGTHLVSGNFGWTPVCTGATESTTQRLRNYSGRLSWRLKDQDSPCLHP